MGKTIFSEKVGARLKELREAKGMGTKSFAEQLGMEQGSYAAWERGDRSPNMEALNALATALDVSADYLLTGHKPEAVELGKQTGLSQAALVGFVAACSSGKGFFEYAFSDQGAAFTWGDFGDYIERAVAFRCMPKESHFPVVAPDGHELFASDWGLLFESEAKRIVDSLVEGYIRREVEKRAKKKDNP